MLIRNLLPVLIVIGGFRFWLQQSDYGFYTTNETQINNSADIITSLTKRNSKVYDYLVTVDAK
jgi:hypothetical protein